MLLTVDSPEANDYTIHDSLGHIIPFVRSFDTETKEIELCIKVIPSNKEKDDLGLLTQLVEDGATEPYSAPILVKFILPGAYAVKKDKEPTQKD